MLLITLQIFFNLLRGLGPGAKLGRLASNYLANIVTGLDAAKYEGLVFVSGCCSLPAGLCKLPAADPRLGPSIWMVYEWHECITVSRRVSENAQPVCGTSACGSENPMDVRMYVALF